MNENGVCRLTVFIPHGNVLAELQKAVNADEMVWGGLPRCIPLFAEADEVFRSLWQIHFEKHSKCVGIPVDISFTKQLEQALKNGADLKKIRKCIPDDRTLSFEGPLSPAPLPPSPAGYHIIMGIKKTPSGMNQESVSVSDAVICKTFQIATLRLELSASGLLTWQVTDSCWAPKG